MEVAALTTGRRTTAVRAEAYRLAAKPEAGMAALDEAQDISRRVDRRAHDVEHTAGAASSCRPSTGTPKQSA